MNEGNVTQQPPVVTEPQRKQAAQLVDAYNKQAATLAVIVMQLWNLRADMGEAGAGQVIISGDGWSKNALEAIPMLRIDNQDFPTQFPAGMLIDLRKQKAVAHFSAENQASFAMARGCTVTTEAKMQYQASLDYAERHGVDIVTAAIQIERGFR